MKPERGELIDDSDDAATGTAEGNADTGTTALTDTNTEDISPRGMLKAGAVPAKQVAAPLIKQVGAKILKSKLRVPLIVGGVVLALLLVGTMAIFGQAVTAGSSSGGSGSGGDMAEEGEIVPRRKNGESAPRVSVDPRLDDMFATGDDRIIGLDRTVLMLDEMHYNIADLEAKPGSRTSYRAGRVTWSTTDSSVVRIDSVDVDGDVSKCHITAVRQGTAEIKAKLPDGNNQECLVKVIAGSSQERPGDIPFQFNAQIAGQMFYMKDEDWGNEFVEAYVNNIEKITHDYQNSNEFPALREEAAKKDLWCYEQKGLIIDYDDKNKKIRSMDGPGIRDRIDVWQDSQFIPTCLTKPQGEISANGWVFLVTTKNEWGYLLHKTETDGWKVVASKALSTGYNREKFEQYMCIKVHRPEGVDYTYEQWHREQNSYQNCVHKDVGNVQGRPDSAGCIRVGYLADGTHPGDELMYYLYHDADLGTRVILF